MARTSASAHALTDHEEIRRWAEERGGKPSCVRGTGGSEDVGMIRIDFPGYSGENSLEEISWDEWFDKFDERGLALLVQDSTARGQKSNFNKLVSRETAEARSEGRRSRSGARRRASASTRRQSGAHARRGGERNRSARTSKSSRRGASRRRGREAVVVVECDDTSSARGRRSGRARTGSRSGNRSARTSRSQAEGRTRRSVTARGRRGAATGSRSRTSSRSRATRNRGTRSRTTRRASVRSISSGRRRMNTRGHRAGSRRRAA